MEHNSSNIERSMHELYLSGVKLYGDDFGPDEIARWFEDEKEGYADLEYIDGISQADYAYHALNNLLLFRHISRGVLGDGLGVGAAHGGEFFPIVDRLKSVTILEPSKKLRASTVGSKPIIYNEPHPSGDLPFDSNSFDLITCLGVLHHIPNVSHVIAEISRVTRNDGVLLLREPVHSMGDWTTPRRGLTKRERGIPLPLLRSALTSAGFSIEKMSWCDFPTMGRFTRPSSRAGVLFDLILSRLFAWNYTYHATSTIGRLRPRGIAIVARRTQ